MPKHESTGSNEWARKAAKKLAGKSISDLEVLATVQYLKNDDENSELVFQAAMTALRAKSKRAFQRVLNKLAELQANQGTLAA